MITSKSISLSAQIFDQLERDILNGTYQRGSILTEMKLSEELGVSRTPIREALLRLEQEHLLENRGKGLVVMGITAEDADYIYEIRKRIEGLAAAACAVKISNEELSDLKETLDLQLFYDERGDIEKVKTYDNMFHEKIYRYSGNVVLYDTLVPLHRKIQKFRRTSITGHSRSHISALEHENIYKAIAAHDSSLAEKNMHEHVCNAHARLHDVVERHETEVE